MRKEPGLKLKMQSLASSGTTYLSSKMEKKEEQ